MGRESHSGRDQVERSQAVGGPSHLSPTALRRKPPRETRRQPTAQTLAYFFILPSLAVIALINVYPLGYTVFLSFFDKNLLRPESTPFVGVANYLSLINSPALRIALKNSITMTLLSVAVQLLVAFVLALLLRKPFVGRGVVRAMFVLPWPVPTFVAAFAWVWILDYNFGLINHLLAAVGLQRHPFLGLPALAYATVVVAEIWKHLPWSLVVMMAGISLVPEELVEAVHVDGGGLWAEIRHAILPVISPVIALIVVLRTIWTFNYFDLVYLMTGGGPGQATMIVPIQIYTTAFQAYRVSVAAAIGSVILVGLSFLAVAYLRLQKWEVDE